MTATPKRRDDRHNEGLASPSHASDTVRVAVRVKPGAGRDAVGGRYEGPHGPALVVAVGAPAVDGEATEAARRAVAKALGVRPWAVELRFGAASRDKVFTVTGPGDLARRAAALRDGAS